MAPTTFVRLSCAITGESKLDDALAAQFKQRIHDYYADDLADLLTAFDALGPPNNPEQALMTALGDDPKRHAVAREIARLWFTGQFQTPYEGVDPPRTPAQWEAGLLWRVIRSHAPAFSRDPYGVWAAKPR